MMNKQKKRKYFCLLSFVLLLISGGCSNESDLEKAILNAKKGKFEEALPVFNLLAEKGNAEAQVALGGMYYEGKGVQKDFKKALEYFSKSAEQNCPIAQLLLYQIYSDGEILEPNRELASMWLEKAVQNKLDLAQYMMALRYYTGIGEKRDYPKAFYWMEKASKQNLPEAQYFLGLMYINGSGVKRDSDNGLRSIISSAKNGYNFAQIILGIMMLMSDNNKHAEKWFGMAKKNSEQEVSYWGNIVVLKKVPEMDAVKKIVDTIRGYAKGKKPIKETDASRIEVFKICHYVMRLCKLIKKGEDPTVKAAFERAQASLLREAQQQDDKNNAERGDSIEQDNRKE